jgi:hypothetical protein
LRLSLRFVRFNLTGKLFRELTGIPLLGDFAWHRLAVQNADRFAERGPHYFLLRFTEQQINFEWFSRSFHTQELAQPFVGLFPDAVGGNRAHECSSSKLLASPGGLAHNGRD